MVLIFPLYVVGLIVYFPARFGLLGVVATLFFGSQVGGRPLTFDTSAWYFGYSLATLALVVGLNLAAFRISLGGRQLITSGAED